MISTILRGQPKCLRAQLERAVLPGRCFSTKQVAFNLALEGGVRFCQTEMQKFISGTPLSKVMGFVRCSQRDEWGLTSRPCSVCYYWCASAGLYRLRGSWAKTSRRLVVCKCAACKRQVPHSLSFLLYCSCLLPLKLSIMNLSTVKFFLDQYT